MTVCSCGRAEKIKGTNTQCSRCYYYNKVKRIKSVVHGIVGTACWNCGYDNGIQGTFVLDFHHINPETKNFAISSREMNGFSILRVLPEVRKCALLCCRCHREYHCGLITESHIKNLFDVEWSTRDKELQHILATETSLSVKASTKYTTCALCPKSIRKTSTHCRKCHYKAFPPSKKIEWPPYADVENMVNTSSYLATGRRLGVSGNAVKKFLKSSHQDS